MTATLKPYFWNPAASPWAQVTEDGAV